MKALGGSYLKLSVSRERERERVGLDLGLCRHDFGFLVHQKRVGDGLVSLRANCVASISTAASAQTHLESEEIQTVNTDQPKTVRVRFKLHKQCAFGQQFLVVGDDPSLGLWDPSEGVPLNWSEGHVWTAQVDIPCSKVINYKFILKEITGTVSWQPGPDRVLETWDTANTISVTGDWEIPEFQIIDEEEVVDDVNDPCLNGSGSLVAENLNEIVGEEEDEVMEERVDSNERTGDQIEEEEVVDDVNDPCLNGSGSLVAENLNEIVGEEEDEVMEERVDSNERTGDQIDEPSTLMVAENISVKDLDGSSPSSLKNEMGLVVDEGLPALVPGLATTTLLEEVEAEEAKAAVSSIIGRITATDSELEESDLLAVVEAEEARITETDSYWEESDLLAAVEAEEAKAAASSIIGRITATDSDSEEDEAEVAEASSIIGSITATESDEMVQFATVFDEIEVSTDPNQKKNNIVDETEAATKPEQMRGSASLHYAETSEVTAVEEKPRFGGRKKKMESNILGNDMQWGRQTLYKFLVNLKSWIHAA